MTLRRTWWVGFVFAVIALNVIGIVLIGARGGFNLAPTAVFLVGAIFGIFGLRVRTTNPVLGSWMIVASCIPPMIPYWLVVPVVISVITIVAGVVTRELELLPRRVEPES